MGCEFCDIWTQYGRKPRLKGVDRFLAELDAIRAIGFEGSVFIVDDNFIGNKKAIKGEMLPALAKWQEANGYPFRLYTEATVNMADDDELLSLMHNAGFDMVFVGIETPDEASLVETKKTLNTDSRTHNTPAKLLAQIEKIQRAGLELSTGLIVGFDNEPADIDRFMADFIHKARIPMAMAGLLTALPETELEARLAREGRLRTKSAGNNTHAFDMNFEPRRTEAEVVASYKRLLDQLYDRRLRNYFERCDAFLDIVGYNPAIQRGLNFENLWNFLRSLIHIVPCAHGWSYLRFLARRLRRDRRTFAEAVTFGIKGHHLAHITRCALEVEEIRQYCSALLQQVDQFLAGLKVSYRQSKVGLEGAYKKRNEALRQAEQHFRKLKRASRARALHVYEQYVREVRERFAQIEKWEYGSRRTA